MTAARPRPGWSQDYPVSADCESVLRLRDVSRSFGPVRAVQRVNLHLDSGEVLGLLGENGAGKSTLIRLIAGELRRDEGDIVLDGRTVDFASPSEALAAGIATVHQHPHIAGELTVAANLVLGREREVGAAGRLRLRSSRIRQAAQEISAWGIDLPLDAPAGTLSVAERQMLEIARAVARRPKLLILDEPTAALNDNEVAILFQAVRRIRASGTPVIFVTHRLDEVPQICDRVVIMRDGRVAGELEGSSATGDRIVPLMVGRKIETLYPARSAHTNRVVLEVRGLAAGRLRDVDLRIHAGEVVGVTGAMGAGQRDLARAAFDGHLRRHGELILDGRPVNIRTPREAIAAGLAYVSGDRGTDGVLPHQTVEAHLTLTSLTAAARFVNPRRLRTCAGALVDRFGIKTRSVTSGIGTLSGGNQQKIFVARWFSAEPRVLILDEPTLGIDVGSRAELYGLIAEATRNGLAVLLVSSDIGELIGLSHRVEVVRAGVIVGSLDASTASDEEVLRLAHGFAGDGTGGCR
jgi:ABC-type sugar transport system ATPase subunit